MAKNQSKAIRDVAKDFNITTTTLRRYCNQGLIPHVRRDRSGHRVLDSEQIALLHILLGMKQAGFRPKEIRRYARLYRQGASTEAERTAMLTTRKRQLWQEITERQKAIDFIERQEEILQSKPAAV